MADPRGRAVIAPIPLLRHHASRLSLVALAGVLPLLMCGLYLLRDHTLDAWLRALVGAVCAVPVLWAWTVARGLAREFEHQRRNLEQGSGRLRELARMGSDWFWELDAQFHVVAVDTGVADGEPGAVCAGAQALIGTLPWDHPGLRPLNSEWDTQRAQLAARQAFAGFLLEVPRGEDATRVLALRGEPVFDPGGNFLGYRGTGADITPRYRAEQALRASEARNRALIDSAPEAIFVIDADRWKAIDANPRSVALFGLPKDALLDTPVGQFNMPVQPGGRGAAEYGQALIARALGGEVVAADWMFRSAKGREFPAELRIARLPGEQRLLRLSVVDISERRAFEAERERLQQESRQLLHRVNLIIDTMPFACIVHNADFVVTTWNRAAERIFGYTAEQMRQPGAIDRLVPPERRAEVLARIRARAAGTVENGMRASLNLTRDGRRIFCEWHGALLAERGNGEVDVLSMAMDVSDRVGAEQALKESEDRFRRLTALSSDWYWELDSEYRFTAITGRERYPHLGRDLVIGHRRWERPELRPVGFTWNEHKRDLDLRKPFAHLVLGYTGSDGALAYWAISGEPVFDRGGAFTGYRGVGSDITQRYRAHALRSGEKEMFERLAAGAPLADLLELLCHGVESALARRGVVAVSTVENGSLRLLAGPNLPQECRRAARLIPLEAGLGCCVDAVLESRQAISAEIASRTRAGRWRDAMLSSGFQSCWSTPIPGAGGRVIGTLAVYHDLPGEPLPADRELSLSAAGLAGVVMERTEAQAALRENEARYRALVEGAQAGVFVHRDDIIEYVNPAMVALMRAPDAQALLGLSVDQLLMPEFVAFARARRLAMAAGMGGAGFVEMQLRRLDGEPMDAEVGSSVISRDRGLLIQAQIHDISARKWTEREILRLNEGLEQRVAERTAELSAANREMEAFSYTVAHDLRAPLRAIDGFSRMLRVDAGERLDDRMRRDLDTISSNARRMAELIDGLLRFARFSRGEAARQRVATRAMVETVILELAMPPGGIRPAFKIGELPDMQGDAAMLRQVWVNLLSNALKFTSKRQGGEVTVDAQAQAGGVCFTVRDNGAGFDPAYADKLFGMFQRLHRLDEFEGTGVGLAIVKRVIERHGGRVWADGHPDAGASFHFFLPDAALAR